MITVGRIERMYLDGEITEEEYLERKTTYIDLIVEMYCLGMITKEELYERLNQ